MVVDGKEEKHYEKIWSGSLMFSPDSKQVVYAAKVNENWSVVLDGKMGKQYDDIVAIGEGRIIFGSPDSLHYLVRKGSGIYLVTEQIK